MNIYKKNILFWFAGMFVAMGLGAQELPSLTPDPAVTAGTLPNGASYYVAVNPSAKGMADFALVQKTGTSVAEDGMRSVETAREALASLRRFGEKSPQTFLTSRGIAPGRDGYVNVTEDATVFRFEDVTLSEESVTDSLLLVLFDIMDRGTDAEDSFLKKWYAPEDQAVIVSGDVNVSAIVSKLRMMSLMVPGSVSSPRPEYVWKGNVPPVFHNVRDTLRPLASVSATWRSPRIPSAYMDTAQPVIYEMFLNELGTIACRKVRRVLGESGTSVADVSYSMVNSAETSGDENFTVTVWIAENDVAKAVGALSAALSSIGSGKVTADEFKLARADYIEKLTDAAESPLTSNTSYINRCVSAFLHNASLASSKEKMDFCTSRDIDVQTELGLFNKVSAALLDPSANLTVSCTTRNPGPAPDSLRTIFDAAWASADSILSAPSALYDVRDTSRLPGMVPKLKLKSSRTDRFSGGTVWTFANGFRVIYKQMNTDGKMYWTLAQNGGYGGIVGLEKGEGAYMTDYFSLCSYCGIPGSEFFRLLRSEGLLMDFKVNMSDTMVSGTVRKENMPLLMRALIAIANERKADDEAFAIYMGDEELRREYMRGTREERIAVIDSIMCPGYKYSRHKSPGVLSAAFPEKADRFLSAQSSRMNDGVMVIVGDMDAVSLKKLLQNYVGAFRTSDKISRRAQVRYQPVSGWSTYTVDGDEDCIDIVMSAQMPMTAENYMAAALAGLALRHELSEVMADTGMYVNLSFSEQIYPQERFNVMISLKEASADGFAAGVEYPGPMAALSVVRGALSDLAAARIPDSGLAAYKKYLKGVMAEKLKDPKYWTESIVRRWLDGKDFITGYESKIDAVTTDKVKEVLSALNGGSKIEYVTKTR